MTEAGTSRPCRLDAAASDGCATVTPHAPIFATGRGDFQVIDETSIFSRLGIRIGQQQQIGRMHRDQRPYAVIEIDDAPTVFVDGRDLAEHALWRPSPRQSAASSRRVLRLVAVAMAISRLVLREIKSQALVQSGSSYRVPSISLELLTKNLSSIPIDSFGDVSFKLEHIMNK